MREIVEYMESERWTVDGPGTVFKPSEDIKFEYTLYKKEMRRSLTIEDDKGKLDAIICLNKSFMQRGEGVEFGVIVFAYGDRYKLNNKNNVVEFWISVNSRGEFLYEEDLGLDGPWNMPGKITKAIVEMAEVYAQLIDKGLYDKVN